MGGNFDIKRTLVTLLVISGIWILWMQFFAPKKSQFQQQQQPQQTQTQTPTQSQPQTRTETKPDKPSVPAPSAAERPPAEKVEIGTARWKARFTTYGGALESFQLLDPQYRQVVDGHEKPIDLVRPQIGRPTLETTFADSSF